MANGAWALPQSLTVERDRELEDEIQRRVLAEVSGGHRAPGLHASDLLDPRQAYYRHTDPKPLTDRLANIFGIGRIGHSWFESLLDGNEVDLKKTDTGGKWDDEIGITYSVDALHEGDPLEFKTTRSLYEARGISDIEGYLRQLAIYMCCLGTNKGRLVKLLINLKDESGSTAPAWRAYTVTMSEADRRELKAQLAQVAADLRAAIRRGDPSQLPLCEFWKCKPQFCEWYHACQPPGRYNADIGAGTTPPAKRPPREVFVKRARKTPPLADGGNDLTGALESA